MFAVAIVISNPDLCFKPFEFNEISIGHQIVNYKTSDSDFFLSNFFLRRINSDESTLKLSSCFEGYFGPSNPTALEVAKAKDTDSYKALRYENATVLDSGEYRFYYTTRLGIGLSNFNNKPIPRQLPIRLTFYRAAAEKGLLSAIDTSIEGNKIDHYTHRVIQLKEPTLHVSYYDSD